MSEQISLSELNLLIKESLELSFPEHVWVVAEIGEFKVNRSGHCYMELVEKDAKNNQITARTRATIWSWQYRFIQPYFETATGQNLQAGLKVLIAVSVEFHEVYGISLNVKDIDPNYTLGDMARKRQEVINKLIDEGVFEMNKEAELPDIPSRIAIISSPTAAGYQDFIEQLQNNDSGYKFYTKLFEATMQGNDAVNSIIAAFDYIYEIEEFFDAVVLIRGGGSQLDLSCFDEYDLALNITQFPLPVLTGIGHEKDESIADMVAHTKLKTPTAVAEFLLSIYDNIAAEVNHLESAFILEVDQFLMEKNSRLSQAFKLFKPIVTASIQKKEYQLKRLAENIKPLTNEIIEKQKFRLFQYSDQLEYTTKVALNSQENVLQQLQQKLKFNLEINTNRQLQQLDDFHKRTIRLSRKCLDRENDRLIWLDKTKNLVDPQHILKRGFSITLKNGLIVKDSSQLKDGDILEVILSKGKTKTSVIK